MRRQYRDRVEGGLEREAQPPVKGSEPAFTRLSSESSGRRRRAGHEVRLDHGFHDPDGFYAEVIWRIPGVSDGETLLRVKWTTVDLA